MKLWLVLLLGYATALNAAIRVEDDRGNLLELARPAKRVVSLAPHITEILYAIGAGDRIVATVEYSDYPPPAQAITRVGNHQSLNIEKILALDPDLIIAWPHGFAPGQLAKLKNLGFALFESDPRDIETVAATMLRLGELLAVEQQAKQASDTFIKRLDTLRQQNHAKAKVKVFYQIGQRPLYTVNQQHLISKVINLCGGVNVFAELAALAPVVDWEAALKTNPDAVIVAKSNSRSTAEFNEWRRWPQIRAVQVGNFFVLNADWLNRHGPRILDGAEQLCSALDQARIRLLRVK